MKVKMLTASAALVAVLCFNAKNAQAAETSNQDSTANEQSNETQDNLKTSKANLEFRVQHLKETNGSKKAIDKLNDQIDRLDKRIIKKQKEEKKEAAKPEEKKPEQKQEEKKETPKAVNNVLSVTQNKPATQTSAPKVATVASQTQNAPAVQAPTNSSVRDILVNKAKSLLGIPYVWGGTNPSSGLDCSGLTSFSYSQIGINIGRTTYDQDATGRHISLNELKPGDLILEYGKGHVAMYIGNGQQIEAPQPGESVKISPVPYSYGAMYGLSYVD